MIVPAQMQDYLNQYITHLAAQRYSPATIRKRRSCVNGFLVFAEGKSIQRCQNITQELIEKYMLHLNQQKLSENHIEALLRSISLFFDFLVDRNMLFKSPMTDIRIPTAKVKMGQVLTIDQMKQLLSVPDRSTTLGIRDRAMLEVLYSSGVRSGELLAMTRFDINYDEGSLIVHGKGSKDRLVPVGHVAVRAVEEYLKDSRPLLVKPHHRTDRLWLSRIGTAVSQTGLLQAIKRYAAAAKLPKHTDVHCIRRSFATHMLEAGCHPALLAEILGHADLTSLAHYLKLSINELKKQHKKTEPGQ